MNDKIIRKGDVNLLDEGDFDIISEFNKKKTGTPFEIQWQLLPEPYIGDLKSARVIFLALNPGFARGHINEEDSSDKRWHSDLKYRDLIINNVNNVEVEYPYYYLNEDPYFENKPGHKWCRNRFKFLVDEAKTKGISVKSLSRQIACIQFHGYHSLKYHPLSLILPSQDLTLEFIKAAINKRTLIVIMRSKRIWYRAVEELEAYENKIILKNFRNPTISRGNMKNEEFDQILSALKNII